MAIALLTNYLTDYRLPLYERLAERHGIELLCYGRGGRYVPSWFADLDGQLERAPFPARRIRGPLEVLSESGRYDTVIAPYAGGWVLPAAYLGARRAHRPFVLWASVWAQPRSVAHIAALPLTRHIYRHADAVLAYGEHVRRFVASIRGRDSDVFVAPQAVEDELFGRPVSPAELDQFRLAIDVPSGPIVLYTGRLVPEKGIDVLLDAWSTGPRAEGTLVLIGEGPRGERARSSPRTRVVAPLPRARLPVAYAAADLVVLPSVPTPRFLEPWGLICNEAMHQGRPVIATSAVGAVAGGLVRDGETGRVVVPGDPEALGRAIADLLADEPVRARLGAAARTAVAAFSYDAAIGAFDRALAIAMTDRSDRVRRSAT
jgi:glycosyltransferase involved in cell wall biosynthesis